MSATRGFFLGAGTQALNLAGAMVTRILLWRLLGVSAYGTVAFSLNLVTVIARTLSMGIAPATQHWGAKSSIDSANLARTAALLGVSLAAVLTLGTYAALPLLRTYYFPADTDVTATFAWLAVGVFPVVLNSVLSSLLLAWTRYSEYNVQALITGVGVPLVVIIVALLLPPTAAVIIAHLVCWTSAAIAAWIFARATISAGRWDRSLALPLARFSLLSWPNTIMTVGAARLVSVVGLAFVSPVEFGFYILAVNITEALFALFAPVSQILFTHVSRKEHASYADVGRSLRLATLTYTIVCGVYAVIGKFVILLVLGADAEPAWLLSLVVLISSFAHALLRLMTSVAAGLAKLNLNLIALGAEVAVLAIAIVPLGRAYGAYGLATASAIGAFSALAISALQLCRLMSVGPAKLFFASPSDVRFLVRRIVALVSRQQDAP